MQKIAYKISFLDFFNVSSGESGGARLDLSVAKDGEGFVFIPAKTIKGVLREIAENLNDANFLKECFGDEFNAAKCHFSNAELNLATKEALKKANLTPFLYSKIASTAIDECGMAMDGSLREIEVAKPMSFYACIENVPQIHAPAMKKCLKSLKRMGLSRTRGLGRLKIELLDENGA